MKNILIANWKMKQSLKQAEEFARKIKNKKFRNLDLVVAPSSVHLPAVSKILKQSTIKVSAQDVAAWDNGSFTGETSARMLKEVGCQYAIIGHSERRQLIGETDLMINEKVKQLYEQKLIPILCIGETLVENRAKKRSTVLVQQLRHDLEKVKNLRQQKLVIAYEPVWAIGTGQHATRKDVEEAYLVIRRAISTMVSSSFFEQKVQFVYGGSVTKDNAYEFCNLEFLHGYLVGGAGLKVKSFTDIAEFL